MIANIVSKNSLDVSQDFNVVDSIDKIILGIPTLIVGFDLTESLYPDFDVLDICVKDNIYWTFKKIEKRDKFNEDLDWFITKVYSDLIKDVNYLFVDPILLKPKTLIKIVRKIYSIENIITYKYNDMLYIYGDKIVFGVDLKLFKFIGFDVKKLKDKINHISTDFLDDDDILIEYKNIVETLGNSVRYIPYLFSIRNGQKNTTSIFHISRES
jgi:hypothetical protein